MKASVLFTWIILLSTLNISAQAPTQLDSKSFFDLIQNNEGVILDVRTAAEYSRGHIEGSTLISISDQKFIEKASLLQKDKPIYIYCLTGSRSNSAAYYLSRNGYTKVYNLSRGIMEWQQYGYPIVQSSAPIASASKTYNQTEFNLLLSSKNLVLVDFHAPWCTPCKKLSPIIDQAKKEFAGKALIEKIDIEANDALKRQLNIQSIPGLVLFKDGKEVWKHTGLISLENLQQQINKYL